MSKDYSLFEVLNKILNKKDRYYFLCKIHLFLLLALVETHFFQEPKEGRSKILK